MFIKLYTKFDVQIAIALKFERQLGSSAADSPVTFQVDESILNTSFRALRLFGILP